MYENEIFEVSGFDLYFNNVLPSQLIDITNELGANTEVNFEENRATYFFTNHVYLQLRALPPSQKLIEDAGKKMADQFGGEFDSAKLHVRGTSPEFDGVEVVLEKV
jgi:hypothetical protein